MDVKKSSIILFCFFLGNALASNIQRISDLQNQINKQGIRIDTIKQAIGSFTGSMEEKAEEITGMKGELTQLKSTVGELEETFALIKHIVDKIFSISEFQLRFLSKTLASCEDLKGYGISESGRYFINGGLEIENQNPPIEVRCEFKSDGTVVTILKNNNDAFHEFEPCSEIGCSKMDPQYKASEVQIKSLVSRSSECKQSLSFDCLNSPLSTRRGELAWWTGFDGEKNYFFHGNDSSEHICQCFEDNTCPHEGCNCNKYGSAHDSGIIRSKSLPMKSMNYGPITTGEGMKFKAQIGDLKCSGSISLSFTDCYDVKEAGLSLPGTYELQIHPDTKVEAFCEVNGWTVIQSRGQYGNAKDYFFKNWNAYKDGFGVPGKEHWIGLDVIHKLTKGQTMKMKISMERFSGEKSTIYYDMFKIADEASLYRLQISGFQGDSQVPSDAKSFLNLNGSPFTTKDVDNDSYSSNCAAAKHYSSGWWFKNCFYHVINPNGLNYGFAKTGDSKSIIWDKWTNNYESLKSISMAIRKASIA